MIQTLPCPGCKRTLVLAAETALEATLRCQHCSQQFVLGEMIEAELGYWEVVSDSEATVPKYNDDVEVDVKVEVAADDAVLELSRSEFDSPQTLLKKPAESKKVDWSKFEPISHEQYERMRRKGKSPVWSMISVLLGGLASIPIATLLIWHVLGKDPLRMGPAVGKFAPWIVPIQFQSNRFAEEKLPPPPIAGTSGFRRFENVQSASANTPSLPSRIQERGVIPEPLTSTGAESPNDRANSQSIETPSLDVFSSINRVEMDFKAWNDRGADRELQKKLAVQTYSSLSSLAFAIERLPTASPVRRLARSELHAIGQQVAAHADIQNLIQSGSRYWISNQNDDVLGLAIVIKVARATEVDNGWQIVPQTALGSEPIQITVPKDILSSLSEGQNLLATGCLTREKSASPDTEKPSSISSSTLKANFAYVLMP